MCQKVKQAPKSFHEYFFKKNLKTIQYLKCFNKQFLYSIVTYIRFSAHGFNHRIKQRVNEKKKKLFQLTSKWKQQKFIEGNFSR